MADVTVKLKLGGIKQVLKSVGVQSEVARRAQRIAAAAGDGFEAVVNPAKFTSRAFVRTTGAAGRLRQAREAVLERSMDAGR